MTGRRWKTTPPGYWEDELAFHEAAVRTCEGVLSDSDPEVRKKAFYRLAYHELKVREARGGVAAEAGKPKEPSPRKDWAAVKKAAKELDRAGVELKERNYRLRERFGYSDRHLRRILNEKTDPREQERPALEAFRAAVEARRSEAQCTFGKAVLFVMRTRPDLHDAMITESRM